MTPRTVMAAEFFLGDDLLPWLLLAFGSALVVGNLLALVRPPQPEPGSSVPPERPPLRRTIVMIVVGALVAIWALASLVRG